MIYFTKYFKYHTKKQAVLYAESDCVLTLGTDKIRLKESKNGYNHEDLAKAAFQHFMCWPAKKDFFLKKNDKIIIEPFVAYCVFGKYKITTHENIFFIS